jgi:Transposase DDE domain/Insertion element 4 transposase N-terminal
MPFRITHLQSSDKLCRTLTWPILEQFYPRQRIEQLVETCYGQTTRVRKLSVVLVVWVLICWHLYLRHSLGAVFLKLSSAERWLAQDEPDAPPTRAAWTYRRKQLGVRLLRTLCEQSCVPLATQDTPGAFAFGLRLMAIDGTLEDVNDTPANAQYFGRISDGKTSSPYPQLRCIYLVEAGTHAIVKVIAAPCKAPEQCLARGLLPAIKPGMLVLVDRGFISGALLSAIRARGAQVLGRLSQGVFTHKEQVLPDGSYLTTLSPRTCQGLSAPLRVRVIEYRIQPEIAEQLEQVTPSRIHSHSGSTNPQVRQVHRLITTLLEPEQALAQDLCLCYHERWEVEETIDETRNQQRLSQQPLRSRSPKLLLQELYALLLAHYAVRCLMLQAAQTAGLDPDRISFTGAIQVLGQGILQSSFYSPELTIRALKRMCADLACPGHLVAPRRLRFNCRVVKHICTRFRRKRPEHHNITLKHSSFADILLI